ncbi:hypothetical protein ACHFCA_30495 [Delftia tsuruhatensis]
MSSGRMVMRPSTRSGSTSVMRRPSTWLKAIWRSNTSRSPAMNSGSNCTGTSEAFVDFSTG